MTILITGSKGITARRLTALLHPQYPVLVATRSASAQTDATLPPTVVFNWTDESTYENPFTHPQAQKSPISAIYIVAPTGELPVLAGELAFIDLAVKRGVTRFVLLGSSMVPEGGPFMGQVHARLRELGVEWAVLRPSWFMQNFSEQQHTATIRDEGKIYTATGDGKIPFCSADDIAAMAFHALTVNEPPNRELFVLGPELLSYDQVAEALSKALGRPIQHEKLNADAFTKRLIDFGVPEPSAQGLAGMDVAISQGAEQRLNDDVLDTLGRPPKSLSTYIQENLKVWGA